jgi:hypothetical protein
MSMDSTQLALLKKQISEEFPSFQILPKDGSWLMKAINVLLIIVTFGQMKTFMKSFITTMGDTVYVPENWSSWPPFSQAAILRHERVHMRQARKYTRPLFSFLYVMAWLPMGLSWWRAKFEKEAYEESLRAYSEYGSDISNNVVLKKNMVNHFVSAEYGWMWPFKSSIEAWYDAAVKKILGPNLN